MPFVKKNPERISILYVYQIKYQIEVILIFIRVYDKEIA